MQQLEQGCSESSEGKQDLTQTFLQEENYNSQAESGLLRRLSFLAASVVRDERIWRRARMWKYDALQISETCLSKTYESLGKHLWTFYE